MDMDIEKLLNEELTARLTRYKDDIATGVIDRDTANSRYLKLQWALYMECPKKYAQPATAFDIEDIIQELRSWILDIQRQAIDNNIHYAGRRIKIIENFIDEIRPIQSDYQAELF